MPKFLADSYKSIPPSSGFEILADHIVHLMDEIHSLKTEVSSLVESRKSINENDVIDIKEDLHDIKTKLLITRNVIGSPTITRKHSDKHVILEEENVPNVLKTVQFDS